MTNSNILNKIENFKLQYENCYDKISKIKEDITRYEYSKGGNVFFRGIYTPYLTFKRKMFSNSSGRVTKNEKNFTFKYGFNKDNQLVYVLRNLDGFYFEEFIIRNENLEIGLCYSQNQHYLSDINICEFSNNFLKSVCHAHILEWLDNKYSFDISEEIYTYNNDELFSIEKITRESRYPMKYHLLYELQDDTFVIKNQWKS